MNRTLPTLVVALVCAAAGCRRGAESTQPQADQTTPNGQQQSVVGLGRIEPADGVIDVGAMMGDCLGRVLVKEGDYVKKGKPLAELESRVLQALEVEAARLNVKKAKAAELGTAAHQQKIELLKVGLELARADQERLRRLSKELATDQEQERQALVVQQAASELESAQAMLRQSLRANQLGLEAARLELKLAEAKYERTQITAPSNGTILKIHVRPGETIANKPILQIADLERMVVVAEVYENEIKHIRLGQRALVTSKAFQSPYDQEGLEGTVDQIGRMISSPVLRSVDPFAPTDRHVVEVRVRLDGEACRQAANFSNLQVDVRFEREGGERKAEGGKRRVEGGKRRAENAAPAHHSSLSTRHSPLSNLHFPPPPSAFRLPPLVPPCVSPLLG